MVDFSTYAMCPGAVETLADELVEMAGDGVMANCRSESILDAFECVRKVVSMWSSPLSISTVQHHPYATYRHEFGRLSVDFGAMDGLCHRRWGRNAC